MELKKIKSDKNIYKSNLVFPLQKISFMIQLKRSSLKLLGEENEGRTKSKRGGKTSFKIKFSLFLFLLFFSLFSNFTFAEDSKNLHIYKKNLVGLRSYLDTLIVLDDVCVKLGGTSDTCGSYQPQQKVVFDKNEPSVIYDYVKSNLDKLQGNDLKYVRRLLPLFTNAQDYLRICIALIEDKFKFKNYNRILMNDDITSTLNDYEEEQQYRRRYLEKNGRIDLPFNNSEAYRRCSVKKIEKIDEMAKNLDKAECMDALYVMEPAAITVFHIMNQFFRTRDRRAEFIRKDADRSGRKISKEDHGDMLVNAISEVKLNIETQLSTHHCKNLWQDFINRSQIASHNGGKVTSSFHSRYSSAIDEFIIKEWLPRLCSECNYNETSLKKEFAEIEQDINRKEYEITQVIHPRIDKQYYNSPAMKKYSKLYETRYKEDEEKIKLFCDKTEEEVEEYKKTEKDNKKIKDFKKLKNSECSKYKINIMEERSDYLDKIAKEIYNEDSANKEK